MTPTPDRYVPDGVVCVQEVLRSDAVPPPPVLLHSSQVPVEQLEVDVARYTSQEWHDLEMERLWPHVWQMACRLEELRRVGDHVVYEIGRHSLIVVRSEPDRIQAFYNACLHRGTQLRVEGGTVNNFRCPFHGFTWRLDGSLSFVPSEWDFPQLETERFSLPEASVDVWGGFVFVNMDLAAPPLSTYLEVVPEHLAPFDLEHRYKAVHVSQVVPCNWKVALEAFFEGFHVPHTHPQSVRTYDHAIQYDVWPGVEHTSRLIQLGAKPSPASRASVSEQEILDAFQRGTPSEEQRELVDGHSARPVVAELLRERFSAQHGSDLSALSDAEVLDQIQYFLFPNVIPWPTVGAPLTYRFRPYDGPDHSLMEVMYLNPLPAGDPEPAVPAEIRLEPGAPWSSARELGGYGPVFDQDMPNLARIQRGLHTTRHPSVHLAAYQESRILHFHRTLAKYVEGH